MLFFVKPQKSQVPFRWKRLSWPQRGRQVFIRPKSLQQKVKSNRRKACRCVKSDLPYGCIRLLNFHFTIMMPRKQSKRTKQKGNHYSKILTLAIVMKNLHEEAGKPAPEVSKHTKSIGQRKLERAQGDQPARCPNWGIVCAILCCGVVRCRDEIFDKWSDLGDVLVPCWFSKVHPRPQLALSCAGFSSLSYMENHIW